MINVKKKQTLYVLFVSLLLFVLSILCFVPTTMVVMAEDGDVSTLSDVDVGNVMTRYQGYTSGYITSRIPSNIAYYDHNLTNDTSNNTISNGQFSWTAGANVFSDDIGKMVFTLNLDVVSDLTSGNNQTYQYDIYRCSKDGSTSEKVLGLRTYAQSYSNGNKFCTALVAQYSYSSEIIGFGEIVSSDWNDVTTSNGVEWYCFKQTKVSVDNSTFPFYGTNNKQLHLILEPKSLTDMYFIRLSLPSRTDFVSIDSKIVSVFDIVSQMKDRDELSYLDEAQQTRVAELLDDGTIQKVQVSWLVGIDGTPFARKKYAWVDVPVTSNTLDPSDVVSALGIETFAVGQSSCQYFKEDTATGIFNAYYLKNVWLSSKDANGNSMNLFLDINTSYRDYFYPFVSDGIFTDGMYEWFWTTMLNKYPAISGIDDTDLYGYFGYTSVPYTYTLNQLVYEMFDGSPNMDGVVQYFSYRENLEYNSYIKLLDDYGYGWLEKAWNTIAGFVSGSKYPADHYFFYVDGEEDNAFIGENGADDVYDNSGAISNGVEDVFGNIEDFMVGVFGDSEILKYIGLVLGCVLVIWLFLKLFTSIFKVKTASYEYKKTKKKIKNKR